MREIRRLDMTLLADLAESARDAIIGIAPDGTILFWNKAAQRIYGYEAGEVLGRPVTQLAPPEMIDEELGLLERVRGGETIEQHETVRVRKGGYQFYAALTISSVHDSKGRTMLYSSITRDVSAQKDLEEELRQARTVAEEASQAKSDFLSHMTHEIRTPMTVKHLDAALGKEHPQQDVLKMAHLASERLLTLVDDILDLSRIEAGKLSIRSEPFALKPLIESTVHMFDLKAREKGLVLVWNVSPDAPEIICGDTDRLGQILVNLIGNAIKFTESGEVEVTVEGGDDPGYLLFSVRDTGIGIPSDKMDRLFERFNQLNPDRARRYGGTGLGLALSKHLVEAMGGGIRVKSAEGEGSIFSFTLPLLEAEREKDGSRVAGG